MKSILIVSSLTLRVTLYFYSALSLSERKSFESRGGDVSLPPKLKFNCEKCVRAVKPNPLNNCTIKASLNQSSEILEVECVPGYDGGLHQEFRLEAYEVLTGNLRVNASSVSADLPIFRIAVADLLPATHFYLVTYAVNAKGRSEVSLLEDIMLRDSEKHTGN